MISFQAGSNNNINTSNEQTNCSNLYHIAFGCQQGIPTLSEGVYATYNAEKKLVSTVDHPYFYPNHYKVATQGYILLPKNLSQLNDYMCGPLNRKGLLCSECADGFGPSVTSFRYRCVNCTDAWYGVPLIIVFLSLKLVPITILYVIVLIFQVKVVSAPIPCFIMYAQFVVIMFDSNSHFSFTRTWDSPLDVKIMLSFYGIFNLDFLQHLHYFEPYCLSQKLKFIHLAFLEYVSAFYPIMLIFLTWVCVELHGRNFRPLVWLWRPFHRCFVGLRRGWDTKSDIIDVFATFFFLTYNRILYQSLLLTAIKGVRNISESGTYFVTSHLEIDLSIKFSYRNTHQLVLQVVLILITAIFAILPAIMLTLYPMKAIKSCLSKCHINFIAINIFMDKVYSCYKDGLDGGRDMRSFSGLYFCLRIAIVVCLLLQHQMHPYLHIDQFFVVGTLLSFTSLTVAIAKPYRKAYMNYWDIAILSHLATLLYALSSSGSAIHTKLLARIILCIPIIVLIFIIAFSRGYSVCKKLPALQKIFNCIRSTSASDVEANGILSLSEAEPLIQPTSSILNYGANNNEVT